MYIVIDVNVYKVLLFDKIGRRWVQPIYELRSFSGTKGVEKITTRWIALSSSFGRV